MLKVSDAVRRIVTGNAFFQFGLHYKVLNLSGLARFLKPLVEARTRKEVQESAVLMNLSRLQRKLGPPPATEAPRIYLDKMHVHTGLCSLTLFKTPGVHRELNRLIVEIQEQEGLITLNEGISEITIIFQEKNLPLARKVLTAEPKYIHQDLSAVGVRFHERFLEVPGLLYLLLQPIALQKINVVEVTSTATEFSIFLHERDTRLAFDSLYRCFSREGRQRANLL